MFLVYLSTSKNNEKARLYCTILCVFGAWIVMALRSPWCGVDLYRGAGEVSYFWVFEKVRDYSFFEVPILTTKVSQEIGWILYNKIISLLTDDFQLFLALTALLTVGLIGFVIYKYSSNIYLSILVFCTFGLYHFFFSGLRQGVAVSLTFFAYYFLDQKKYLIFCLLVLLASTMHSSALVFLLALPLSKINFTPRLSLLCLGGVLCLLPFLSSLVQFVTDILFPNRYHHYEDQGGAITMFVVYVFIYFLTLWLKTDFASKLRGILLFAVLGQSLGIISTTSMTRIGFYFSIFFALVMPELSSKILGKKFRTLGTFMVSILFILYFYLTVKDGYLDVIPYYFFWEKPI